jgi:hypothetical protein
MTLDTAARRKAVAALLRTNRCAYYQQLESAELFICAAWW